ncbi:MAG: PQQ-binding-like beta-propeller repeat protein [Tepidisphaeraceae bacterium]
MLSAVHYLFISAFICGSSPSSADDWPQWLGPQRDGVWRETGIVDKLTQADVKYKWRVPVGTGYAGPAVAAGRLYVMDRQLAKGNERDADPWGRHPQDGLERILCLDAATGKQIWTHEYAVRYAISYAAGPRTTPTVEPTRLYTFGAEGHLKCLEVETGKVIWEKRVVADEAPIWGCDAHPLVDGDRLFVYTGDKTNSLKVFDKNTGKLLWQALASKEPGYSPPVIVPAGGTRQLIQWTPESLNSFNPATGDLYWSIPFGPVRYGTCIWQPVQHGRYVFIASEQNGAMLVELDADKPAAKVVWQRAGRQGSRKTEALHNLMSTVILTDTNIFGVCKMAEYRCLDLKTGDRLWETFAPTTGELGQTQFPSAFTIPVVPPTPADLARWVNRYFIANDSGELLIARLTPEKFEEMSRAKILDPTNSDSGRKVVWSHPAFAGRCMFWRNDRELVCVDLAK